MAGRKLSFKKYLAIELKRLTNSNDFRLFSFCDNLTFTALPYAHVYAHYYSDLDYFKQCLSKDKFINVALPKLPKQYKDLLKLKDSNTEYYKVFQGYNTYLDHTSANSNLKKIYHKTLKEALNNTATPVYKVCDIANVSQGNLTLFLKGDLSKLSLDKCRALNMAISQMS